MSVICGDSLHVLPTLDAESVDAIVCDPPYGLSFMGKDWDHGVPGEAFWREAWRVAKPGAHLVAFGGTRTYHRLAVAIEDAGWEIRDCLSWLYGSGFPKSHDVSKAIDKMDAAEEQRLRRLRFTAWVRSTGASRKQVGDTLRASGLISANGTMEGHYFAASADGQPAIMTREHLEACRHLLGDVPEWVERECDIRSVESRNFAKREVVGSDGRIANSSWLGTAVRGETGFGIGEWDITAPATDLAREWQGWGTALKPAWEPIILARKPLIGTVAANVTQYGTGALNVDGCRIRTDDDMDRGIRRTMLGRMNDDTWQPKEVPAPGHPLGRWPANVCLDEEAAQALDEQTGKTFSAGGSRGAGGRHGTYSPIQAQNIGPLGYGDTGGASRFFYTAKASRREREAGLEGMPERVAQKWNSGGIAAHRAETATPLSNVHPTVKPISVMRWLCRLVTPKGGLILDPFTGSGTTGCAAVLEGFRFVGVEREPEYVAIAEARIAHWSAQTPDADLFTEAR